MTMPAIIHVRYTRKPVSLKEVQSIARDPQWHAEKTRVTETHTLTAEEYDAFTRGFLRDCAWLAGKGGSQGDVRQAVAVIAPERTTLYVDPSGHAYARYVGMAAPAQGGIKYPHVRVKLVGEDGNAFMILGLCQRAARRANLSAEEISAFMQEAKSGDYDHLLQTCQRWFTIL